MLEVQNLTKDYENKPLLKGVSFKVGKGELVCLLGSSGSGKSTILRIIGGLYRPSEGLVDVDGVDLRQLDPGDFRQKVGYVPQDSRLFNGTLRDNVLLGRPGADATRLAAVARLTGLARVAESHPLGWDLPVGESGSLLSGGQRQLVALTRSLITEPKVLLMDEPTSSMDAQSETLFLRQLREAAQGCTQDIVKKQDELAAWFEQQGVKVNKVDRAPFREAVLKMHNGPAATWDQATYDKLQAIN